ncbi:MAG: ribonuclease E, partial [Shewanella sp.]
SGVQERPVREKDEAAKRPAKVESKPRVPTSKDTVADSEADDAPKQEVARERRQRRNMRRKVRIDNGHNTPDNAIPIAAEDAAEVLAEIAALNAAAASTISVNAKPEVIAQAPAETKAPRTRRQPRKEAAVVQEAQENAVQEPMMASSPVIETPAIDTVKIVENTVVEVADFTAVADVVSQSSEVDTDDENANADDQSKREQRDGQRRSRRSPRHLRAAGQRRRRDEDDQGTSTPAQFVPNDELGADQEYPSGITSVRAEIPVVTTQTETVTELTVKTAEVDIAQVSAASTAINAEAKIETQTNAGAAVETRPVETKATETKAEEPKAVEVAPIVDAQIAHIAVEALAVQRSVAESITVTKVEAANTATFVELSVEVKEMVKATASAPMAKPAAIIRPQAIVQATPTAVDPQITDAIVVSKPKPASRFGSMVSSDMTKPVVEVREQVAVPKGREYENAATEESTAKIKLTNGAGSDMTRP